MNSKLDTFITLQLSVEKAEKLCAVTGHVLRLVEVTIAGAKQDGYHPENDCLDLYMEKLYIDIYFIFKRYFDFEISKYIKWYTKDKRNYSNLINN